MSNKVSKKYRGFIIKYYKDGILRSYRCDTVENLHRRFVTDKPEFKPDEDSVIKYVLYDKKNLGIYNITYKEFLQKMYIGIEDIFKYKQPYIRKRIYKIEDVLSYAINPFNRKEHMNMKREGNRDRDYDGDMIHMDSERYQVFLHSLVCSDCGIVGQYFAKETTDFKSEKPRFHFNMYATDDNGQEVLMTKDHIIPKSKGGRNHIDNYQTMCELCNKKKGNKVIK